MASSEVCPLARRRQRLLEAGEMIVTGLDVHTEEKVILVGSDELLGWAAALLLTEYPEVC